jgi:K+-transporting ATPase ATPase A chain
MAEPIVQLIVALAGTIGLSVLFGRYIARMITYEDRPLEKTLGKIENGFYKIIGINKDRQMSWKEYFVALIITDAITAAFLFFALVFQDAVPFATPGVEGLSIDLAFNTAASFVTNTNLQHYIGDQQLTIFSQMALTFVMFVAPASAIAAAFAFIRGFMRKNFGLGNFYVDFTRIILTLLLPVAFFSALFLMALGSPQTLDASATVTTLEGSEQVITMGPGASL